MIPEPPDGTKLVVIPERRGDIGWVVERDDAYANSFKSHDREQRWQVPDKFDADVWQLATWEEVQALGTLHLIGPELTAAVKFVDFTHPFVPTQEPQPNP